MCVGCYCTNKHIHILLLLFFLAVNEPPIFDISILLKYSTQETTEVHVIIYYSMPKH